MLLYPLFEKGIAFIPSVGIHFYLTPGEAQGFGYLDLTIGAPAIDCARLIVVCSVAASWKEFGAIIASIICHLIGLLIGGCHRDQRSKKTC